MVFSRASYMTIGLHVTPKIVIPVHMLFSFILFVCLLFCRLQYTQYLG